MWRRRTERRSRCKNPVRVLRSCWFTARRLTDQHVSEYFPALDEHFTVYIMDRREHSYSSDSKVYSIASEAEDVTAVTVAIGQPGTLLAHSYGALCTLLGLGNLQHVSHLILYEPASTQDPTVHKNDPVLIDQLDNDLRANRKEEALVFFLKEFAGVPAPAIDRMRALPNWSARVEMAPLLLREVRSVLNAHLTTGELEGWSVPTVMFIGSTSPQSMKDNSNGICRSMRNCQVMVLEGQGHLASTSAPDLFVAKVLEGSCGLFLSSDSPERKISMSPDVQNVCQPRSCPATMALCLSSVPRRA